MQQKNECSIFFFFHPTTRCSHDTGGSGCGVTKRGLSGHKGKKKYLEQMRTAAQERLLIAVQFIPTKGRSGGPRPRKMDALEPLTFSRLAKRMGNVEKTMSIPSV